MDALEPLPGSKAVSSTQKARVIMDQASDDETALAALEVVLPEAEYTKVSTARQYQVPPSAYVDYRETVAALDDNGNVTQAEARQALDTLDLPRDQKAALWQIQNSSWKPGKNPYSSSTGQQVYNELQAVRAGKAVPTVTTRYGGTGSAQSPGQVQTRCGALLTENMVTRHSN